MVIGLDFGRRGSGALHVFAIAIAELGEGVVRIDEIERVGEGRDAPKQFIRRNMEILHRRAVTIVIE